MDLSFDNIREAVDDAEGRLVILVRRLHRQDDGFVRADRLDKAENEKFTVIESFGI